MSSTTITLFLLNIAASFLAGVIIELGKHLLSKSKNDRQG